MPGIGALDAGALGPMKIFVTVGAQMPFDRLILAIDRWAAGQVDRHEIFSQIGETSLRPANMQFTALLEPRDFARRVAWADVLVAHAGMGSILNALEHGKPIVVLPRLGLLKETRNDHQVATAQHFRQMPEVAVAMDEDELARLLDGVAKLTSGTPIADHASSELIQVIRDFVHTARR